MYNLKSCNYSMTLFLLLHAFNIEVKVIKINVVFKNCLANPLDSKRLAVIVPLSSLAFKEIRFQIKLVMRTKPQISAIMIIYDLKMVLRLAAVQ